MLVELMTRYGVQLENLKSNLKYMFNKKINNVAGTSERFAISNPEMIKSLRDGGLAVLAIIIATPEILDLAKKLYDLIYIFQWDWMIAWNLVIVTIKTVAVSFIYRFVRNNNK